MSVLNLRRNKSQSPVNQTSAFDLPPLVADLLLSEERETAQLGADLALALRPGDAVALLGDLGVGKSTLSRALIRTLADDPELDVPSPTYTLVQAYETRPPVAHFDLYRIGGDSEIDELGFAESLEAGVALVEWPQNAPTTLRAAQIVVDLAIEPGGGRRARIFADADAALRVERTLAIRQFLRNAGHGETVRRRFTGDASARRYETVETERGVLVLMDAPRQPDGPPVRDGLPYSQIAHLAEDVVPFVAVAEALRGSGFAAPDVLASDLDTGLLLLTHLGVETVLDQAGRPVSERYAAAIDCLAELHAVSWSGELPVTSGPIHNVPTYDRRAMRMEVDLLIDWYLPRAKGRPASAEERNLFGEIWSALFDELRDVETSLVLRDYHSPNIIWRAQESGRERVGIIDFQDALIGPAAYDVASLAQDARVDIPAEMEAALVSRYIDDRRKGLGGDAFDPFGFEQAYAIMAAQRASKILGIFVRLLERDGKPQYLRHIPRLKAYLGRSLGHPALAALRSLYADWGILDSEPSAAPSGSNEPSR